ncbi:hypothetical protein VTN77DRAFT_5051 [Rasamsonia byssochlamydoides]|uniref:uncharacterized protein n=1 Tax=Rasamsonia byssochlamydoides TaxID=89139 RepID=UPI003744473D
MMGLHRDGSTYGLSQLETEIRRRVWNKLLLLDIRLAEELGFEPAIAEASFDTHMPNDIDDDELTWLDQHADLGSVSSRLYGQNPRRAFTEMTFSLIRYDIAGLLNRLLRPGHGGPVDPQLTQTELHQLREKKRAEVDRIFMQMRQKYHMSSWDMSNGLHRLALRCVNTQVAKARLLVDIQFRRASDRGSQEAARSFLDAVRILEETIGLRVEAQALDCTWYTRSCSQFHATALILFQIARGIAPSDHKERAWHAIDCLYGRDEQVGSHLGSKERQQQRQIRCACSPGYDTVEYLSDPIRRLLALAREIDRNLNNPAEAAGRPECYLPPQSNPSTDPSPDFVDVHGHVHVQPPNPDLAANNNPERDDFASLDDEFLDWITLDGCLSNSVSLNKQYCFTSLLLLRSTLREGIRDK